MATPSHELQNARRKARQLPAIGAPRVDQIPAEEIVKALDEVIRQERIRLTQEIAACRRRGDINLAIGILITLIALGVLASSVLFPGTSATLIDVWGHSAPRLFISVFMEASSLIFLRLYSSNSDAIKGYQNELKDLALWFTAGRCAALVNDQPTFRKLMNELILTDRNGAKSKGEIIHDPARVKLAIQSPHGISTLISRLRRRKKQSNGNR